MSTAVLEREVRPSRLSDSFHLNHVSVSIPPRKPSGIKPRIALDPEINEEVYVKPEQDVVPDWHAPGKLPNRVPYRCSNCGKLTFRYPGHNGQICEAYNGVFCCNGEIHQITHEEAIPLAAQLLFGRRQ